MSGQMQMAVRSLHSDTHFHLQGKADRCKTHLGTRPGDCWTDLIFSFLWARLLKELEQDLIAADILDQIPVEASFRCDSGVNKLDTGADLQWERYMGPTWMNDS